MRTRDRLAHFAIHHRRSYLVFISAITLFLAAGLRDLHVATVFSDLLPDSHEFVRVFRDHPDFGSPLTVQMLVKRVDGDIFHADTLDKVWRITRDVDLIPGVDPEQTASIATEKARVTMATPSGIVSEALMDDGPPLTSEEISEFQMRVPHAQGVAAVLVSQDYAAALIRLTFIEKQLDYGTAFERLRAIAAAESDAQHDIYMAGLPVLVGWVYLYVSEMWWIFAATLGAMILALILYMRNLAGVLTPLLVSAVSAVWAFGFVGWIGHSVEPLTMVVPVLLVARSFSHSIQVTERYYEILHSTGEPISAAENALSALLAPGTLGIITDAAALLLIGVTPIPMMEKFALFCGFWALSMFPANVLLSPVLLSVLPAPRNVNLVVSPSERTGLHTLIAMFLSQVARFSYGRRRRLTGIGLITVFAAGAIGVDRLMVGSDADGSPLLWEDAHYNQAVREINRRFAGMNTLELVFEAGDRAAVRSSDAVHAMHALQRHLESLPDAPAATLSLADYLPELNRLFSGGNPKWLPLDRGEGKLDGVIDWLLFRPGSNPKQFSHVLNLDSGHGVVRVWQKDLRPDTLERTVTQARSAIDSVGVDHGRFRIRLGSGNIALEQAVNETVAKSERIMLFLLIGVILLTCSVAYRSAMAGVVLLVPVIVSNLLLVLAMVFLGIGLSIHTLPITAIGIGIGIDYGIYLLSRLCEEARREADLGAAIDRAVGTSGMAIFFTATVVLIGLLPWYFLSELKFQADMGLLLTLVMMINMIVALIVVPYTVRLLKPRFVSG